MNRVFDDGGSFLTRGMLRKTAHDDWRMLNELLTEWQSCGYIEIIEDPLTVADTTECVRINTRIPAE